MQKSKTRINRKNLVLLISIILGIVIIVAVLEITNTTHLLHQETIVQSEPNTQKKITSLPQQPAANNGEKQINGSSGSNSGTAVDNNGSTGAINTSPSMWNTSASGVITVKTPVDGSRISTGFSLIGSAKSDLVEFRLIDDARGVISQGQIKVVSGVFSAQVNFKSFGSAGRLDVFTTDTDGRELNEVQIGVKF